MRLKDRVAVITGGSRGIGKAIARRFLEEGAAVVITATNEDTLRKTAEELGKLGKIEAIRMDVSQFDVVQETFKKIIEKYGRVDILVNNAGIPSGPRGSGASFLQYNVTSTSGAQLIDMPEERFDQVISVNLKGVFACSKAVVGSMIERGSGRIINMSSVTAHNGSFGQTNYAASKAGIIAMTQTWAKELGRYNITVNSVAPGYTMTEMIQATPEKVLNIIKEKTPLKRLGKPEEIAAACVYLASDEAGFVTGTVLKVDGGIVL
ncbi:glucose 1-dehydrogenase [Caproiciproducens sp. NJN-50]|uniref:SDR family NAD(P)-dependent oxidoreductase n=1 Tax=Caproiciproducens sp. NJN-50 TaxID=2507162 RepID=UPI000FFE1C79|nr:3-oxoacyl-ACP reductase FabG [Caproiciproducens sp. NJN-50]QAT48835.1 glucose 1-dehydrogenase [Caproiciproducens sp. NJN-50]